jgi:tripartite-type tricarboxylate transporter receptor subunit TctC
VLDPQTVFQIAIEMLKRAAKVEMTFVPYPGAAPAVNAMLGEHVTSVLTSYTTAVAAQLNAGKLRARHNLPLPLKISEFRETN